MPSMTDPFVAYQSFRQAVAAREIEPEPGRVHSDLVAYMDRPNGSLRMTYGLLEKEKIQALVIFATAEPIEGVPCFGVGYAVDESQRNRGLATRALEHAIDEFRSGVRPHMPKFYLEAVIGADNHASQRVASRMLCETPKACIDSVSGLPALAYTRLILTR
jgi:GNAT superfamily N-acetyltransferase